MVKTCKTWQVLLYGSFGYSQSNLFIGQAAPGGWALFNMMIDA